MLKKALVATVTLMFYFNTHCLAEEPEINLYLNFFSKYLCSFGMISLDNPNFQPNIDVKWKNGAYVGALGFMGFDDYNDDYGDEWDYYVGWTKNYEHLSINFSYWYYQFYDLGKSSDDMSGFVGRFGWLSFDTYLRKYIRIGDRIQNITPYFYIEHDEPISSQGPEKGITWQVGTTFESQLHYPIFADLSIRGTDGMVGLKPGITCARLDLLMPVWQRKTKSGEISLTPNLHLLKINGDPDSEGKGFQRNIEFYYGLCLNYRF